MLCRNPYTPSYVYACRVKIFLNLMLSIDNYIKNLLSLFRFVKVQYLILCGLIIQREIILIQKMRTFKVMRILSRSCRTYASPFSPCLMMMSSRVDLWYEQFLPMSIRISIETIEKELMKPPKFFRKFLAYTLKIFSQSH